MESVKPHCVWKTETDGGTVTRNISARHYQGSLIIPIPEMEGWSWEPVYRKQVFEPGSGRQIDIDRYMIHLNKKSENIFGSGWDFGFRNRWEIIDIDDISDQIMRTRFRGKLSKDIPGLKTCGEALRFWVSDEVFYNFEFDLWSRNRLATGIDIPLSERATVSVGFQWETFRFSHREHNWDDNHMILVEFKYNFPHSIFSD